MNFKDFFKYTPTKNYEFSLKEEKKFSQNTRKFSKYI